MNNPIANLISSLKNAGMTKKESISVPYSKIKQAICEVLKEKGYIADCQKKGKVKTRLVVELAYNPDGSSKITDIRQVSKYSRRIYRKVSELKPFKQGFGIRVISTPAGVICDKQAKEKNVGGEVLLEIW